MMISRQQRQKERMRELRNLIWRISKRITNSDATFAQPFGRVGEKNALLSKERKNSRALTKSKFI